MKPTPIVALILSLALLSGCKKELSLEMKQPDLIKAEEFRQFVTSGRFQLRGFYSNIPIDYVETDTIVKQETNLWSYVSGYLKDDYNTFFDNSTDVDIEQNAIQMSGLTDPILHKKYFIGTDESGVYMDFLDYQYTPLKYRLVEITSTYFIVSVSWKYGATLYSRFEKI